GVQRWVKFAKYLPENGWEPIILTIDPAYAAYPVTDNSLLSEVPESLTVHKTPALDYFTIYKKDRSKIPSAGFAMNQDNSLRGKILRFVRGNFFIPDPRKGWNNQAFRKACELIRSHSISHVITTSPPHSTQLIGLKLKKTFPSIRWIADLRDPWTDIYYYDQFYPTYLARHLDSAYEKKVLSNADSIITVGPSLRNLFVSKIHKADSRMTVITNGYDDEDFIGDVAEPEKFTITYAGTLSDIYPVGGFLDSLEKLKEKDFQLRFVGSVSQRQRDLILSKVKTECVSFLPYADHRTAIRYMRESSVLLLIIPDHRSNRSILTGKLFEYIASRRPIICLGPVEGDAAAIISQSGHGRTFSYTDNKGIGEYLDSLFYSGPAKFQVPALYSRKELTRTLTSVLQK
ncbi:MAG TPA: glycosyltransferase, partial [Bacteroidales bacterium]|nr:glycosyltransferase [Bacteroidales bacterium]